MSVQILTGDVRAMLATLPDASVQVCVTSPPYFGLRSYSTTPQVWGGDPEHAHVFGELAAPPKPRKPDRPDLDKSLGGLASWSNRNATVTSGAGAFCSCGAWRGELGSEPTPALFIEHLVSIFDAVGRVMRPDATLWVNLGDSYAGSGKGTSGKNGIGDQARRQGFTGTPNAVVAQAILNGYCDDNEPRPVKAKSLLLIPERFAIAMQDAGWIVRSRIAWCKTSAMPESVRDRPTSAWEVILMFSKQARYFYDADAVRQPHAEPGRGNGKTESLTPHTRGGTIERGPTWVPSVREYNPLGANLRNFWLLGPEPSREQHYAAFPSEIPRRCILAATSERGQCAACGAPWIRQTESSYRKHRPSGGQTSRIDRGNKVHDGGYGGWGTFGTNLRKDVVTTGWQAGCSCEAGDPVPQLVLDPFLGSGTTALVADQLGRNAVGIELNPEYAEMARRRITNDGPMFADVTVSA